jgi:hypothetical protein
MWPLSKPLRAVVTVTGAAVLLSALATLVMAAASRELTILGFEVVTLVAAALTVLVGRGRFADGPALALLCTAGSVGLATALEAVMARMHMGQFSLLPLVALRGAAVVALLAVAAGGVLSRAPRRSWPVFAKGVLLLTPVAAVAAAMSVRPGRRALAATEGWGDAAGFLVPVVGFLLLTALLAAGVHLVIRAFEFGRDTGESDRPAHQ